MIQIFSYLIGIYFVSVIILFIYLKSETGKVSHSIEEEQNITDLLFLKLLLDFIYKNNLMLKLNDIIENMKPPNRNNVLKVFRDIIPEAETQIEGIYRPVYRFNEIKKNYDMVYENFIWLQIFAVIYGIIILVSYIIYILNIFTIVRFPHFIIMLSFSTYMIAVLTSIVVGIHIFRLIEKINKDINSENN